MESKPQSSRFKERLIFIALIFGLSTALWFSHNRQMVGGVNVDLRFSPKGGCTDLVVAELNKAKTSVRVQAYSFTSAPIAEALVEAHKRQVYIEVILDRSQRTEKYSSADFLNNMGVATYIDASHAIAHNKVMIIDDVTVITGSFNFTKSAEERNAENLLILYDRTLASRYTDNWKTPSGTP